MKKYLMHAVAVLMLLLSTGCGLSGFQRSLSEAMMNNPDPDTIRQAMPTFLVATDAMIASDPDDVGLLRGGAELYSGYAVLFVDEPERGKRLVARGKSYAERALCLEVDFACNLDQTDFETFVGILNRIGTDKYPTLFNYVTSWLAWARFNSADWGVIASLPKYQAALEKIVAYDENFGDGSAMVYSGMVKSLRPPSLGGKPEEGRACFERAIALSEGRNLSAKVELASSYARLVYDRELHDKVLKEVLEAPVEAKGLTLQNALAKERARELLKSAEDYF